MKEEIRLPEHLSDCIRLALEDEEKAFKSPLYQMDMETYHESSVRGEPCHVCFAGSVMAGTLKQSDSLCLEPQDFDTNTEARLKALDKIRKGDIAGALSTMNIPLLSKSKRFIGITPYQIDRDEWREHMLVIANHLQAEGL